MDPARRARLRVAAHCGNEASLVELTSSAGSIMVAPDKHLWPSGWDEFAAHLLEDPPPAPNGRMWFPGSPFPAGHALELDIAAQLTPDGLQLTIDLESENYRTGSNATDPEDPADWQAASVWDNYGTCLLGGTILRPYSEAPLDLKNGCELIVDPQSSNTLEDSRDELAFWQVYILGHDSVAAHNIVLRSESNGPLVVVWSAKVAMTYAGSLALNHMVLVEHGSLSPLSFSVDSDEVSEQEATEWLSRAVIDPEAYSYLHEGFVRSP